MAAARRLLRRSAALSRADAADGRRADELRLRARLCRARAAEGAGRARAARSRSAPMPAGSPAPTRSACPSRGSFRSTCRSGAERRSAPSSTNGGGACRGRWRPPASSSSLATSCASRSHSRRASRSGEPYLFPVTDGVVDYEATQTFRRVGDYACRRAYAQRAGSARHFSGLLAFGDGGGFEFRAVPGPVPTGGTLLGGLGAKAILLGSARRDRRAGSCST